MSREEASPATFIDRKRLHVWDSDGQRTVYTLRGLTEGQVPTWADFCASIFAYKEDPPPPSYFARHYYNDPERNASFIRVAVLNETIVASCRIFCRNISYGVVKPPGLSIRAGGIGEVCTAERHRKRGLSKELLDDAIRIMEKEGMQLSLLHAASNFFPVYEKAGYSSTLSKWSVAKIQCDQLPRAPCQSGNIREARFPNDTEQLMMLHQRYSENQFAGCVVRSANYWNNYLSHELAGSFWLLTDSDDNDDSDETILGWLSVLKRGDMLQLREFGCHSDRVEVAKVLATLLAKATGATGNIPPLHGESFQMHVPTFLVDQLEKNRREANFIVWDEGIREANDEGWMYLPLGSDGISMTDIYKTCAHLIWPADSF